MRKIKYIEFPDGERLTQQVEVLDERGNILESQSFDDAGFCYETIISAYDEHNNLINRQLLDENSEEIERNSYKYEYQDEKPLLIEKESHYPDGSFSKETHKREAQRYTISSFDEDNELESREERIYDEQQRPIQLSFIDDSLKVSSKVIYQYDDQERKVMIEELDHKGHFVSCVGHKFNENGAIISDLTYNKKKQLIARTVHHYEGDLHTKTINPHYVVEHEYNEDKTLHKTSTKHADYEELNLFEYQEGRLTQESVYEIPNGAELNEAFLNYKTIYTIEN